MVEHTRLCGNLKCRKSENVYNLGQNGGVRNEKQIIKREKLISRGKRGHRIYM